MNGPTGDDPVPEEWDEFGDERNWDWRFGDDPTPEEWEGLPE